MIWVLSNTGLSEGHFLGFSHILYVTINLQWVLNGGYNCLHYVYDSSYVTTDFHIGSNWVSGFGDRRSLLLLGAWAALSTGSYVTGLFLRLFSWPIKSIWSSNDIILHQRYFSACNIFTFSVSVQIWGFHSLIWITSLQRRLP